MVLNNFYGREISEMLPLSGLKLVEKKCQVTEDFMGSCNKDGDIEYFIETDVQYPGELHA